MATLLYIEDDQSLRQLVQLLLARRDNMTFIEAETGKEGIALARQELPDLVLIDISLPDLQGDEVLTLLRSTPQTAHIPAVAISGNAIEHTRLENPGFDGYLGKPINIQDLYATLDALLK